MLKEENNLKQDTSEKEILKKNSDGKIKQAKDQTDVANRNSTHPKNIYLDKMYH